MEIWQYIVHIHRTPDWTALTVFWGSVFALVLFTWLQLRLARAKRKADAVLGAVQEIMGDLRGLRGEMDALDRRMQKRLDSRAGELDERITKKVNQRGDLIEERLEQRAASLSDTISALEARVSGFREKWEALWERVREVENRIPGLFDRLDEFRGSLARTFQVELEGVLSSFDNSMAAILDQMKADLQMGVSRVESIENMVRSRESAERNLLGPAPAVEPTPDEEEVKEEYEEEEWEQKAEELTEQAPEQEDKALEVELVELRKDLTAEEEGSPFDLAEPEEFEKQSLRDELAEISGELSYEEIEESVESQQAPASEEQDSFGAGVPSPDESETEKEEEE